MLIKNLKVHKLIASIFCKLTVCLIILFIAYGCAGNKPAIINAAGSGDINTVKRFHAEGRNINEADSSGATPLMYAIWNNKADVAKFLIASGANIKAKDNNGYDALIWAVQYKQHEIINILIDRGADIESIDSSGRTPLFHAVVNVTDVNVFKKIASTATNVNPRDEAFEIVKLLIKKGANVNAKDNASETVLETALSMYNGLDIVAVMVNSGANLFEPTQEKARFFLIGYDTSTMAIRDGIYFNETVDVNIGDIHKYIRNDMMAFADVPPGSYEIRTNVGYGIRAYQTTIDAKAGQTYYFKVSPTEIHSASRLGGLHRFDVTPMEAPEAKNKIRALLKTTN